MPNLTATFVVEPEEDTDAVGDDEYEYCDDKEHGEEEELLVEQLVGLLP